MTFLKLQPFRAAYRVPIFPLIRRSTTRILQKRKAGAGKRNRWMEAKYWRIEMIPAPRTGWRRLRLIPSTLLPMEYWERMDARRVTLIRRAPCTYAAVHRLSLLSMTNPLVISTLKYPARALLNCRRHARDRSLLTKTRRKKPVRSVPLNLTREDLVPARSRRRCVNRPNSLPLRSLAKSRKRRQKFPRVE